MEERRRGELVDPNEGKSSQTGSMFDEVQHPRGYNSSPSGIECIEVTRHMNFNVGNAVKYLWRNGLKSDDDGIAFDSRAAIVDLKKAMWYINDEIRRLEDEYRIPRRRG
jgi:hypothetical protein